jgi:hypothetical protein
MLQVWEAQRTPQVSPIEHEQKWEHAITLRGELEALRRDLEQYAKALAKIAGIEE